MSLRKLFKLTQSHGGRRCNGPSKTARSVPSKRRSSIFSIGSRNSDAGSNHHCSLHMLIRQKSWKDLCDFLETEDGRRQVLHPSSDESGLAMADKEDNALHLACHHGAPLDVIQRLCEIRSDLPRSRDARGWTALHAAAASWCSVGVIMYLLEDDYNGAAVKDADGRTPLHHACRGDETCCNYYTMNGPHCEVIDELCKACPSMVNEKDCTGTTALEYAIQNEVQYSVIKLLRTTSEILWKKQQKDSTSTSTGRLQRQGSDRPLASFLLKIGSDRKAKKGAQAA